MSNQKPSRTRKSRENRVQRTEGRKIFLSTPYSLLATLILICLILPQTVQAATTNQISQFGITWTFDREYEYGQFANGDYWVVGPVTIIEIFPSSFVGDGVRTQDGDSWVVAKGRVVNGAMIVTDPTIYKEGYDSAPTGVDYDENLNVAGKNGAPISSENPLVLSANTSLISCISLDHNHPSYSTWQGGTTLKTAAVLTILNSSAPEGSFRPPYAGTDKAIKFNENQLNYHLLGALDKKDFVDSTALKMKHWTDPQKSSAERMVDRVWLDHLSGGGGESIAPFENMLNYPGYRASQLQQIAMLLQVDWTGSPSFESNNQYKRDLLVNTVQIGIDLYGIYQAGAKTQWSVGGGHGIGRKWPILFAGVMLEGSGAHPDATAMADIGFNAYDDPHFDEDDQSFYVSQRELDIQAHIYTGGVFPDRGWADPDNACEGYSYLCRDTCGPDYRDAFFIRYTQADVDNKLPEWGMYHRNPRPGEFEYPFDEDYSWAYKTNRAWNTQYRRNCTNAETVGLVLSMHIMGLKDRWNHDSFFDFTDRYIAIEKEIKALLIEAGGSPNYFGLVKKDGEYITVHYNIPGTPYKDVRGNVVNEAFICHLVCSSAFVEKMWDEYRADYPPVWPHTDLLYGDLNKDGKVNIQDVQCCVNHILGKQDWGTKADVNKDGKVDELDVREIVNIILGE